MRCGAGSYAFPRQLRVTMEAKDLLQNLLCPDPDKRISVAEIEVRCTSEKAGCPFLIHPPRSSSLAASECQCKVCHKMMH